MLVVEVEGSASPEWKPGLKKENLMKSQFIIQMTTSEGLVFLRTRDGRWMELAEIKKYRIELRIYKSKSAASKKVNTIPCEYGISGIINLVAI